MSPNSDKPTAPGSSPDKAANDPTQNPQPETAAPSAPPPFGQRTGAPDPDPQNPDDDAPPQEGGEPADPIADLNSQVEDLTSRLLTAHADIQNLHKRLERERTETAKYAITKFARDTVAVADNFERAITSVPEGATDDNPVLKALLDGVTMTEREFLNVLDRHGVRRVEPNGKIFDPHRHQAVMEERDESIPSGTIVKVFQPGYEIEDRVLRPAMVVVAKGGPKPDVEEDYADEPEDDNPDE